MMQLGDSKGEKEGLWMYSRVRLRKEHSLRFQGSFSAYLLEVF
jgi:hypothetical protein